MKELLDSEREANEPLDKERETKDERTAWQRAIDALDSERETKEPFNSERQDNER